MIKCSDHGWKHLVWKCPHCVEPSYEELKDNNEILNLKLREFESEVKEKNFLIVNYLCIITEMREEINRYREALKIVVKGYEADEGNDFDWNDWYIKANDALKGKK